ncbi:MAG: LacI family DNA-binding transcriptional regulator, partial [Planctomycetes bacterium]|nr:LacI family DNA-binding transcriptional regulator [Planctomycetota bacterium]
IGRLQSRDSVVLVGQPDHKIVRRIQETGCKLCLLDSDPGNENEGWDIVSIDNKQGSEIAADMFIKNNHKRLAYVGPSYKPLSFSFRLREKSFGNYIKSKGLKFDKSSSIKMSWDDDEDEAKSILESLITGGFTGVYGGSFEFTAFLYTVAQKFELQDKLSFIGFCDDPSCQRIGLNTIGLIESQAGEAAIDFIVNSHNSGVSLQQEQAISTYYIDRGSVHFL